MKVLFIPVSGAKGIGEYMRSVIIAGALSKKYHNADLRFILSEKAPYFNDCAYPKFSVKDSPTKTVQEVKDIISDFSPDIVIFDASGRASQIVHAQKCGAKVIFISQHKKKRRRGIKLNRLPYTDVHWVVQPEFVIGSLSFLEKLKLLLLEKTPPICIGPVFSPINRQKQDELLQKFQLKRDDFILFNAGSGGHQIDGKFVAKEFALAAQSIAEQLNKKCVMLYGSNYPEEIVEKDNVVSIVQLDNSDFINLMGVAKLNVLSGGDSMLQALALRKACIAIPVSKDQPLRVKRCGKQKVVVEALANKNDIIDKTKFLLQNDNLRNLQLHVDSLDMHNGLDEVLEYFSTLESN